MKRRPWTDDDLDELRRRFPVERTADIAHSVDRTFAAVRRRANLLGIRKSDGRYSRLHTHYQVRPQTFDVLDTDSAYLLGFILADGSISRDRLKISNNRLDVILFARQVLGSDHAISPARELRSRCFDLLIHNRELVNGLRRWAIVENKSLVGRWPPNVPDELFGDLLRGYFDGDGHSNYHYHRGLRVKFTSGSPALLEDLAIQLHRRGLPLRHIEHDKGRPNANRLWYYGSAALALEKIMYASGGFHIAYKRQPFLDYPGFISK